MWQIAVSPKRTNHGSCRVPYLMFLAACSVLGAACVLPLLAQESSPAANPAPTPTAHIDLSIVGYREPSRMDRLTEVESSESLDVLDADHVLVTFNPKKLFKRLPGCTPEHQDRLMHAAVVEVPSGRIVKEADWYLHDRRRYLWPLGPGKFLLRRLNDLYLVDASLREKLIFSSPKELKWVTVTPDGSQIVIETEKDAAIKDAKLGSPKSPARSDSKYVVQFLNTNTLEPKLTLPLPELVKLSATSHGYVDFIHKGDLWLVRFGPGPDQRRNIARVKSRTIPMVFFASDNSFLIGRCAAAHCDYSVSAFTITGHRLWRQHWNQYRVFPEVIRDEDSSRFGVSTLHLLPPTAPPAGSGSIEDNPDDIFQRDITQRDVFQQDIQVFETATGNPVFSLTLSPAVLSGQNFSLSPDGRHLAVLRGLGVDWFDLQPVREEDRTKFAALNADIPDLVKLSATDDSSDADAAAASHSEESASPAADTPENAVDSPPVTADNNEASASEAADSTHPATKINVENSSTSAVNSPAGNASPPAHPVTTIRVTTKAVVVDVVVTDAKGHPVHGLKQQDFQLVEDGKPQDLHSFREYSDVEPPAEPAPSVPVKPSPNVFTNESHAPGTGSVTLVLFDLLNTPSADQVYARQQLIKFLETKPKNAQFALCTMSLGSRLHLIQGFTPDETLLLAAVKSKKGLPKAVRWQAQQQGMDATVNTVGDLAAGGPTSGFQGLLSALQETQTQEQVADTDERVAITIDSMMLLARYLSGLPGRKNLVWLSGSFPISISATSNSSNPAVDNPNYTYKIKRVTNLLAESQIAVYPVDVRGLMSNGVGADSAGGMGGPTGIDPQDFSANSVISPAAVIPQDMQVLGQQAAERDTLVQFATATGGKAFYNTNGIREAIGTAAEQGANYYTLSYSPANKIYNGKFRKIKVLLSEKGYSLHYRQGYYADDTNTAAKDADLARRTRAVAMQHGSPPAHEVIFKVTIGSVGPKKKVDRAMLGEVLLASSKKQPDLPTQVEVLHYSIDYVFEGAALRFIPLGDGTYQNAITLMATSFDSEGKMLTGVAQTGKSNLEPAIYKDIMAGDFRVHQEVDVPVQAASIRLGIQDQMTNRLGTVEIALPVPPLPDVPRRARHRLPEIEPD